MSFASLASPQPDGYDDDMDININLNDGPPPIEAMFINTTDTLQRRQIPQTPSLEWNDRPPLFKSHKPQRPRLPFWRGQPQNDTPANNMGVTEQEDDDDEDPLLLKGVSTNVDEEFVPAM
jgi:hypothetical protein